jgi:hypothetical protein
MIETLNAAQSGTFLLGGDLPVHRLGFGAMRITGPASGVRLPITPSRWRCSAVPSSSA